MTLDLAKTNGNGSGRSIAELLEEISVQQPVPQLQELSRGSIAPLEEFAKTLRDGSGEEQLIAYKGLNHFVELLEGRFYVPRIKEYKEALQAYEAKQSLAH